MLPPRRLAVALALLAACTGGSPTTSATSLEATASASVTTSTSTDGMSSTTGATTRASSATSTTDPLENTGGDVCMRKLDLGVGTFGCDIWTQDDCCPGEKCTAWADDGGTSQCATRCVPVDPRADAIGEPCTVIESPYTGLDSCEAGAKCWYVDARTNTGICVGLCQGSEQQCTADPAGCCPDHFACTIYSCGALTLCLEACHPLTQDCLAPDAGCYPVGNAFQCETDVSGSMGAAGDPCEFINVCDPGTFCGNPAAHPGCDPEAGGCCIPFCLLDAPECPEMTECMPWYDPLDVPPGYEDLGACVIP